MTKNIGIDDALYDSALNHISGDELRTVVEEAIKKRMAESANTEARHKELLNHPAFGMWKDRKDIGDGVEYQRKLRAEWE